MVRIKNRYLLVNILYPELEQQQKSNNTSSLPDVVLFSQPTTDKLNLQTLLKGIRTEVSNLFGDYGSGAIAESLVVKYLSPVTSTFILRVSRAHYRIVWAALSLMNRVPVKDGKNCVFRVVRVSGTIRKAEEEAIRRAREMVLKARRDIGGQGDSTLDNIFGKDEGKGEADLMVVDTVDSEEDEEINEDG